MEKNIDKKVISERNLFGSEHFAHQVLSATLNGIYIYDLGLGRNVYINEQYTTITGYTLNDLAILNKNQFQALFHPDDKPHVVDHMAKIAGSGDEEAFEVEYRFKRRDGHWIWCFAREAVFTRNRAGKVRQLVGSFLDITQRKVTEQRLAEREKRYKELVQYANSAIVRWRRDGTIVFFNEYAQHFFGYRLEEVLGKNVSILVPAHGANGADLTRLVQDIVDHPQRFVNNVNENIRRDGRRVWMTWTNNAIMDKNGKVAEILAIGSDITERREAEVALRKSEARFRQLADAMPQLIWTAEPDGQVDYFNRRYSEYHGIERLPDGVYQWKPVLHRDDVVTTLAAWKTALRAGEPYQCEHRVQLASGDYHWHLSRAVPMRDNDGNIIKWYGTATDIDRFKRADERVLESERRLSAILEQLPVGVGLLDKAGQFVLNNSILKDLFPFGIMPSRDPARQGRFSAFAADGRRLAPEQWPGERALRGEIVNPGIEFLYIDDEKKEHWILASAVPFSSADNEVEGAIVVTHDISDRKLAEEKLRNLNQTLEQLVDERTEIARIRTNQLQALTVELIEAEEAERRRIAQLLHDDLQQMLVAAKLHLELCAGDPARDSALENVGQMLRAAITKTRHLSHELSPLVLDHDSLFNGLRWLVGVMKEQFGLEVTLNTHAAQDMGNEVMALFIHRAVQELLFNVVKHAGTKKALVSLASTREGLAVDVIDHGTGFDPDRIDSGACGSIGLGLRSLRERASYLGGSLTIQSAPQQRASFSLTVPIKQKEVSERRRPVFDQRRNAPEAVAKPARMDKLRVLFVDDHSLMRQGLLKVVAGNPAIEVVGEAANGREAIRQARKIKPDVIVMDIAMPEMNGIEATYLIKQEFPEMRIIGLSMSEEDDRAKQMQRAGAEVLISKSALAKDLLNAIYGIASKPEIS